MKKSYRNDEFTFESMESYTFDDGINKDAIIDIVNRLDSIGDVVNISGRNYEEDSDKVQCKFSSVDSLTQQILFLDIDDISFDFLKDHIGYSISIRRPSGSVIIFYNTKSIPFDFETLFNEIELELRKKSNKL